MTGFVFPASAAEPKYKADVPKGLLTPDKTQTEMLGELEFFDGMPSDATVKKTRDFIDLSRAVDSFLNGIPAASIYAMLEGLKQDHDFLLKGDVFTKDAIDMWIDSKTQKEINPVRLRPHLHEFFLYYDI